MATMRLASALGAITLASCLGGWIGDSASARGAGGRTALEFVGVAHLDPTISIAVNVVTGRLRVSGDEAGNGHGDPVVALEDPLRGHQLFRYTGGVPGLTPAPATPGSMPPVGPDQLPVWRTPTLVRRAGRLAAIQFSDGRRIAVLSDPRGRVASLTWPAARAGRLQTTIRYAGAQTTITDPFGVPRTYQHDRSGAAFELVPAAWRRGPGYRRWIAPVLDSPQETNWVQHRTVVQRPRPRNLTDAIPNAAGPAFGTIWKGAAANGGYLNVGLSSLHRAAHVESVLESLGLLDITDLSPTFDTARSLDAASSSLSTPLAGALGDCHITWGENVDSIDITVASTITLPEITALAGVLEHLDAWAIIRRGGPSVCVIAATPRARTRRPPQRDAK